MIAYVTTLLRYQPYGWVYKVDLDQKRVLKRAEVHANAPAALHGGPLGLASAGDLLVIATYYDLVFLDRDLNELKRYSHPYLSGGHGLNAFEDHIWVSASNIDALLCFSLDGELLEYRFLVEDESLMSFFGLPVGHVDRDRDYRHERVPYEEHVFHVNHIQETADALYLSLHKQAVIWDLKSSTPACRASANQIHDGQLGSGGRYMLNDTGSERLLVYSQEGELLSQTPIDIRPHLNDGTMKRIRASLPPVWPRLLARIPLISRIAPEPKRCRINWVRGLCESPDGMIWVGSSPASILCVDVPGERVTDCITLSENVYEAVYGILIADE